MLQMITSLAQAIGDICIDQLYNVANVTIQSKFVTLDLFAITCLGLLDLLLTSKEQSNPETRLQVAEQISNSSCPEIIDTDYLRTK
jgi:hypothetical protein